MKLKTKFQDEDFDLGEVIDASIMYGYEDKIEVYCTEKMKHRKYNSIKDFTDHWEDATEEPKEYWHIFGTNITKTQEGFDEIFDKRNKEIGNYFETKEEAEKAVEKLKSFKRLKDKGFRFIDHIDRDSGQGMTRYEWDGYVNGEDLDLLFSGEDD